jgi:hypothetical protein
VESVCEYFHPSVMSQLVETLINGVLEEKESHRKLIGELLSQLLKQHILLRKQFEAGFRNVLEFAGDLVVDIPKIWDYFGDIIGNVNMASILLFSNFSDSCASNVLDFMALPRPILLSNFVRN